LVEWQALAHGLEMRAGLRGQVAPLCRDELDVLLARYRDQIKDLPHGN